MLKQIKGMGTLIALTPGYQLTLFPHIYRKLGYDSLRDFEPVSTVCTVQYLLVVGPLVPAEVETVADFVADVITGRRG